MPTLDALKVHIFVQPPLGIPGDPMRLLFERDMTPHPQVLCGDVERPLPWELSLTWHYLMHVRFHHQYAAFYKWLEAPQADGSQADGGSSGGAVGGLGADAVLHFGMHGTVEWLPGTPLGNTGECWPDILTLGLPHV